MSVAQQTGALAMRMKRADDGAGWAKIPPPGGAAGTHWEQNLIELAEAGDPRFLRILAQHVERGVIRSERARAVLSLTSADAVS